MEPKSIITEKSEIAKCQRRLMTIMESHSSLSTTVLTGHKGSSYEKEVFYSEDLDIWWDMGGMSEGKSGARYWNAFGIGKPIAGKLSPIICEINYPEEGINNRIAAFWLREGRDTLLVHSGKIGGGRKGIGKTGFIANYNGEFLDLDVEGAPENGTIIGNLNDPRLPYQIKNFVFEVHRIKDVLFHGRSPENDSTRAAEISHRFNDEFIGTKEYMRRKEKITTTANHGLVVRWLKEQLEALGKHVANDNQRDLYIFNKRNKIETIFEIKTSLNSQSIFTAVGQLFVNSARIEPLPKLVFVMPENPNKNFSISLARLNIKTLVYSWHKGQPLFQNLDSII